MRAFKRWFRRWRAFHAARPQLCACRPHLERIFGGPVTWRQSGGRGQDVVCLILRAHKAVGVLRMTKPSSFASTGQPFVLRLLGTEKINREWHAYTIGYAAGLTPQPLWRSDMALLCAFVDAASLDREAVRQNVSSLKLATEALPYIARLHSTGIAHMDMSLANILYDIKGKRFLFVDFEHGAAKELTFEQQCLYDYLRLLESVWKFLSPAERASAAAMWGEAFLGVAPARVRAAEIAPLRSSLGRILAAAELRAFFDALAVR
jgi:hypothetical protein